MAPGSAGYRWDPAQYDWYARARGRPFDDLVSRIDIAEPARVVGIGRGPASPGPFRCRRFATVM